MMQAPNPESYVTRSRHTTLVGAPGRAHLPDSEHEKKSCKSVDRPTELTPKK